jgi:hypothetical protein
MHNSSSSSNNIINTNNQSNSNSIVRTKVKLAEGLRSGTSTDRSDRSYYIIVSLGKQAFCFFNLVVSSWFCWKMFEIGSYVFVLERPRVVLKTWVPRVVPITWVPRVVPTLWNSETLAYSRVFHSLPNCRSVSRPSIRIFSRVTRSAEFSHFWRLLTLCKFKLQYVTYF